MVVPDEGEGRGRFRSAFRWRGTGAVLLLTTATAVLGYPPLHDEVRLAGAERVTIQVRDCTGYTNGKHGTTKRCTGAWTLADGSRHVGPIISQQLVTVWPGHSVRGWANRNTAAAERRQLIWWIPFLASFGVLVLAIVLYGWQSVRPARRRSVEIAMFTDASDSSSEDHTGRRPRPRRRRWRS